MLMRHIIFTGKLKAQALDVRVMPERCSSAASHRDKLPIVGEQALGMLHRRTFLHLSACAGAQLAFQRVVRAQSYPDRPITLVVPFPAGDRPT